MNTESREDRIVMLDKSFVDALFKLHHYGAKNQGWTINQSDSLKGNFSCHFPIGHIPSTDQVYFVGIKKDIRMMTKQGSSMHTGKMKQAIIAKALTLRDEEFTKYIDEEQRGTYSSLIQLEYTPSSAEAWDKARDFKLCKPTHKVIRNMVRTGMIGPVSETKDVLHFVPIERETPPSRRVWYFAEPGRACFSRPGATQATPKIPEDLIQLKFRSVSATGSHWTDHCILIGEPRPIDVAVEKTSNVGNKSSETHTVVCSKRGSTHDTKE